MTPHLLQLAGAWIAATIIALAASAAENPAATTNAPVTKPGHENILELPLDQCLGTAMRESHRRPASRFAVAMAEAQHRQALAGYWPQISAKTGYEHLDQAPNFIFPASQMAVPAQTINVPAGTAMISVPAQLVNPLAPPGATVAKIVFFSGLLPKSLLMGESEHLVLGGYYNVRTLLC